MKELQSRHVPQRQQSDPLATVRSEIKQKLLGQQRQQQSQQVASATPLQELPQTSVVAVDQTHPILSAVRKEVKAKAMGQS